MPPSLRPDLWRVLALVIARLGLSAAVRALGVRALSDDDYARTVIAERCAFAPSIDPSGTSWLPLPFWVHGLGQRLAGPSLAAARGTADLLAASSAIVLYASLRGARVERTPAFAAALLAVAFPAAAVLGAMTVPELPTAALGAGALLLAGAPGAYAPWAAALLVLPAALSRYEAWPVALVVAVALLFRAGALVHRAGPASISLGGPIAWIAWNGHAHGDGLRFLHRVAAYRAALPEPSAGLATTLARAPIGATSVLVSLVAALALGARSHPSAVPSSPSPPAPPLARWHIAALGVAALVLFLLAGDTLGGAPTHHPERTLLLAWIVAAMLALDLARGAFARSPRSRAALVGAAAVAGVAAIGDARAVLGDGLDRASEERIGEHLRATVAPGERVLVSTPDYGYFAVIAAFGRPADAAIDRSHDPREADAPSILATRWQVGLTLERERAHVLVAPVASMPEGLPAPRFRAGALGVYSLW